jgi:hypothetical protein
VTHHDPTIDELGHYLDGEVSENRATAIREHLAGCADCRDALDRERQLVSDVAAPVALPNTERVAELVRRLDAAPASGAWTAPRWWWASGGTAIVALAAVVIVVAMRSRAPVGDDAFRARGAEHNGESTSTVIARRVGVAVNSESPERALLEDGSRVTPSTSYVLSYRNIYDAAPLYLLAFAVDSHDAIHWLRPAYLDASEDPLAAPLPQTEHETVVSDSVVFDDIPSGTLRIVTIVSPTRPRVSAIERLRPQQLSRAALETRWHDAVVREVTVQVTPTVLDGDR